MYHLLRPLPACVLWNAGPNLAFNLPSMLPSSGALLAAAAAMALYVARSRRQRANLLRDGMATDAFGEEHHATCAATCATFAR